MEYMEIHGNFLLMLTWILTILLPYNSKSQPTRMSVKYKNEPKVSQYTFIDGETQNALEHKRTSQVLPQKCAHQ